MSTDNCLISQIAKVLFVTTYYSEILTEVDMSGLKVNSATKITRFEGSSEASSPGRKVLVWYLDLHQSQQTRN